MTIGWTSPELMDTPKTCSIEKEGTQMGEINRYFSREFKVNAVQLVTKKKMSVRQAAEELDIEDEKGTWNNQALYIFLHHSH